MRIGDLNIQKPDSKTPSKMCIGENGEFMTMGQFAKMIELAGGKVVQFVNGRGDINMTEADIAALVKEEDGRSNQEKEAIVQRCARIGHEAEGEGN